MLEMFQSPCGEEVMKVAADSKQSLKGVVSVPSRGRGDERRILN